MSSIKFVDSVPRSGSEGQWVQVRAELRANPGRWAEVARAPKGDYRKVNSQRLSLARHHADIEAIIRTIGGDVVVYARAVAR